MKKKYIKKEKIRNDSIKKKNCQRIGGEEGRKPKPQNECIYTQQKNAEGAQCPDSHHWALKMNYKKKRFANCKALS